MKDYIRPFHMPVYKRSNDPAAAEEMAELLRKEGLDATVVSNAPIADQLFIGAAAEDHHVLLPEEQFERADQVVQREAAASAAHADRDHYLYTFTDKELYDLLLRPDEWSAFDHELAKRILAERGTVVPDQLVNSLREKRVEDLRATEPDQTVFIAVGYLFALTGGLFGVAIAWFINTAKKTLPTGERVYMYNTRDRSRASWLFYIAMGSFLAWTVVWFKWHTRDNWPL